MTKKNWEEIEDPVLRETAWEREMHFAGMARFEASRFRGGEHEKFTDGAVGNKVIQKVIKQSTEKIGEAIETATDAIEAEQKAIITAHKVSTSKKASILCLPANTMALLAVKTILDGVTSCKSPSTGESWQKLCLKFGRSVEEEFSFRQWIANSRASAKEYAKEQGWDKSPRSMAEKLLADEGASARRLKRWRETFDDFEEVRWDDSDKALAHYCGDLVLQSVVDTFPEWFEIHFVHTTRTRTKHLRMTEALETLITNAEWHMASVQVVKKPMLTKPKKWTVN